MWHHSELTDAEVRALIRSRQIQPGGYKKKQISGTLRGKRGKRMRRTNRIFFAGEEAAREHGYIPCGNCMRAAYHQRLAQQSQQKETT